MSNLLSVHRVDEVFMSAELLDEQSVLERANVDVRVATCRINHVVLGVHPQVVYFAHFASFGADRKLDAPGFLLNDAGG